MARGGVGIPAREGVMNLEGKELHTIRRATKNVENCEHDFAAYPTICGSEIRIVKCRKCKLEAMLMPSE